MKRPDALDYLGTLNAAIIGVCCFAYGPEKGFEKVIDFYGYVLMAPLFMLSVALPGRWLGDYFTSRTPPQSGPSPNREPHSTNEE